MKKSQMYSQVFIYMLTIMLVSFIFVYGFNSMQNFKTKTDELSCLKMKRDIVNTIGNAQRDFGSVKRLDLQMCPMYREICLVENFEPIDMTSLALYTNDPIIIDSIKSESTNNAFLVDKTAKEAFYAGQISTDPDIMCIKETNNRISLKIEGKGNFVSVGRWG